MARGQGGAHPSGVYARQSKKRPRGSAAMDAPQSGGRDGNLLMHERAHRLAMSRTKGLSRHAPPRGVLRCKQARYAKPASHCAARAGFFGVSRYVDGLTQTNGVDEGLWARARVWRAVRFHRTSKAVLRGHAGSAFSARTPALRPVDARPRRGSLSPELRRCRAREERPRVREGRGPWRRQTRAGRGRRWSG